MKRIVFVLLPILVFLVFGLSLRAQPPQAKLAESPSIINPLMRMKLERSKAILEGLALEDFEKIASNARALKLLSMESGWNVIQTTEYASQNTDFRRATDLIAKAADEKDIHRAAMGYVALTVRCVECHSYMRDLQSHPSSDQTD